MVRNFDANAHCYHTEHTRMGTPGKKLRRRNLRVQFPTVPLSEKDFPRTLSCQPHMTRYH